MQFADRLELGIGAGIAYQILKFMDLGIRYSHALVSAEEITETDEAGDPLPHIRFYNQYTQLFVRFKLQ